MGTVKIQRRGHMLYETNPSLADKISTRVTYSKPRGNGESYMVLAPGTGEIMGKGTFGFLHEREVDTEEFVKLYFSGMRTHNKLTRPGLAMFEYVYEAIFGLKAKDKDTFQVNFTLANRWRPTLGRQSYFKGMKELLDNGFIYRSIATDVYFVNVRFMFNGDRIVLAQSYRRKKTPSERTLNVLPHLIEGKPHG